MGFKRPFDEEDFQEFPLKHPRQVDCGNKLISFMEIYPCKEATQKADIPGEGDGFSKFQSGDGLEYDNRNVISYVADKELEVSAPLSWVTSSTSKEDVGLGTAVRSSLSPEYFEFYFPRRSTVQLGDTYSSLLDGSPRKQIPIGPNHQAEVPVWDPRAMEKYSLSSDHIVDAVGGKLMGDCVFPIPDPELSAHSDVKAGDGRKDCMCPDQGSIRCMRQHVKEARERIRETLGHEKFVQLGFGDMGEEVSQKWTKEDERVFHEVVYSNPVSHGKKFWKHLSMVFPTRMKKEIISYYFNVFMLWRRAVQNRSNFLDIDSDDDEWQGSDGGPFRVTQENEDYAIESLVDQGVRVDHDDDSADDDDDNDYDDENGENCDAQNVVFECQPQIVSSLGSADTRDAVRESGVKGDHKECLHGNDEGSADGLGRSYLWEPCDAKIWDASYPIRPFDGVDLLSTGKMIEEIFGPSTQNRKLSDEKNH